MDQWQNTLMKQSAPVLICFSLLAGVNLLAAPGQIILFNGTSSAGKSSLAEVVVQDSKTKYEVVSFDDFHRSYRKRHGITSFNREQYEDFRLSLYRHAKAQSDAGRNIIIDTVEFDLAYDKYCEILDCPKVIKAMTTLDPDFVNSLGVVRFAHDHTLLYDNRVILVVKNGSFAWERSLRTDTLQG